jgi:hypothetical protein
LSDVQAEEDQVGLHPGRRGPRHGEAVRQRLLPDHHLQVRGSQPLLQEHVQAQAAARALAQGRRCQSQQSTTAAAAAATAATAADAASTASPLPTTSSAHSGTTGGNQQATVRVKVLT